VAEDLRRYYESELTFIRQLAAEFAQKHRKIAARLQLRDENKESSDPHVERLIEAFALLTARVRSKIDDQFPEIVESLLQLLYPHYLRPVPPMAIAQFRFDPSQTTASSGTEVPAGSVLRSRAAQGVSASFRTIYPVTLAPVQIRNISLGTVSSSNLAQAPLEASHVLKIQLTMMGALPAGELKVPSLRFYMAGDGSPRHTLYELLAEHAKWVELRPTSNEGAPVILRLPPDCIRPVGFEPDQGMLPYPLRSFPGYRLLQEYFHFPEKFFFFDVAGLDTVDVRSLPPNFEIDIFFRDSEIRERIPAAIQATRGEALQLGCTPVVNLFERIAEPIRVSHTTTEYAVVPDRHRPNATEVYSIDRVISTTAQGDQTKTYEPFYSIRHTYGGDELDRCYWHENRRESMRANDDGTEVYLQLVDLDFEPSSPGSEVVSVHVTCTNRDFVNGLRWQREWGDLTGEGLPLVQVRASVPPTKTHRPPLGGALHWRLISHLGLNHLSLDHNGNPEALREILGLYCFDDENAREQIRGISNVTSKAAVSRVVFESGVAFCRGLDVDLEFDENQFTGGGAYVMASVLERFLCLYSSMNSFTRLTALSKQRRQPMGRWNPRVGERRLV
jgi:type VI secretion system protein ImpG